MLLKDRIKKVRQDNKLTQTEYANKIGVGRSYIAQLESGKTEPSKQLLSKIIEAFSLSKAFFDIDSGFSHKEENKTYTLSEDHPLFKTVKTYQTHYPEIEHHISRLEDLLAMSNKLHAPLSTQIAGSLELIRKSDLASIYGKVLNYLVESEVLRQNSDNKIDLSKVDDEINQLNLLLISTSEQAKAFHETFYNLFKKWVIDELFIDDVIRNQEQKMIDWTVELLQKKNIKASREEAEALYHETKKAHR